MTDYTIRSQLSEILKEQNCSDRKEASQRLPSIWGLGLTAGGPNRSLRHGGKFSEIIKVDIHDGYVICICLLNLTELSQS